MLTEPKAIVRALLSPFIGHQKAKNWQEALKKSSGWSSEKTLKHDSQFQFNEWSNEIDSVFVLDERFMQIATAFMSIDPQPGSNGLRSISVLDIGGGFGKYFFLLRRFCPNVVWTWVVVETEAQCKSIPEELKSTYGISFRSDIPTDQNFDVGLLSGVIEYVEQPFELLELVSSICEAVILNRTPLTPFSKDIVAIQRPGFLNSRGSYPLHMFSEEVFIKKLEALGEISMRWFVPQDSPVIRFHHFPQQGLVFRSRRLSSV
jgi:putative methyltransferase (TIGR04325 family)